MPDVILRRGASGHSGRALGHGTAGPPISTADNTVFLDLSPDIRILVFTARIAVATAVLFGIFPALRFSRVPLVAAMKGIEAPETVHRTWFRARSGSWIVASQVALSLVLLMVAGLFLRSLTNLVTLDLGFDRNNVLLRTAILKPSTVPPDERLAVYQEIEARLRSLPGVVSVGKGSPSLGKNLPCGNV